MRTYHSILIRKKFNFWYYRWYKITCGKRKSYFKEYEDFRAKIISEENIIKNHLIINEINTINSNFLLEDLVKN